MFGDTKFINRDGKLYLKLAGLPEREVLHGWESFSGWYWFATEKVEERKITDGSGSVMPDGDVVDDVIWFGYVQGLEEEWGYFSQAELEKMMASYDVWEIPRDNLPWSGRR